MAGGANLALQRQQFDALVIVTASSLNSSVYLALAARLFIFVICAPLAWIEPLSKGYVFREQRKTRMPRDSLHECRCDVIEQA